MHTPRPFISMLIAFACTATLDAQADRTVVFDLSPFTPPGVVGEVFGVGTVQGEVIAARLDVTYVSNDSGPWTMAATFVDFPMGGAIGVSSATEGWSGVGTFHATVQSNALNGALVVESGAPFYAWFMTFQGGTPMTLPGGGVALVPVDGFFETLRLTLTLAPCPFGDPDAPWTDLGGALSGSLGDPVLVGAGSLCEVEAGLLGLSNVAPGATTALVVGGTAANAPFKGGVLVPAPDFILFGLSADASGNQELAFTWPSGVPSGSELWFQHWLPDAAGAAGFAASNAIRADVP